MSRGATPRRLWVYVSRRLGLRGYLGRPGDGRRWPQIPASGLLWAVLVGHVLRAASFHGVEALVRSPVPHHHVKSLLMHWLLVSFALTIERLYRLRYLRRGTHPPLTAMAFVRGLWLSLGAPRAPDTS